MLNKWLGDRRRMSIASEETRQNAETTANEESGNERKLRTENENLTKEIVLLSQQKLEFEVSQFSVWFIERSYEVCFNVAGKYQSRPCNLCTDQQWLV